jgi:hypothetical protein
MMADRAGHGGAAIGRRGPQLPKSIDMFHESSYHAVCPSFGRRFLTSWIRRRETTVAAGGGAPEALSCRQPGASGTGVTCKPVVNFLYMGLFFTFGEKRKEG